MISPPDDSGVTVSPWSKKALFLLFLGEEGKGELTISRGKSASLPPEFKIPLFFLTTRPEDVVQLLLPRRAAAGGASLRCSRLDAFPFSAVPLLKSCARQTAEPMW